MTYDTLASKESVDKTSASLAEHGFMPEYVETKEGALAKIKELIPVGASVINGASQTLDEIGYVDYLKAGQHGWNNLHEAILAEKDLAKQSILRKQAVLSDFYLGSVHAVSETGELVIGSASGSQMPGIVFTSPNIIFVVGTQKIVPSLDDARVRLTDYVVQLEDARAMQAYSAHTSLNKELILHGESTKMGRKVHIIFVNEKLGY
jgi:L-lactate utilization protein LutB